MQYGLSNEDEEKLEKLGLEKDSQVDHSLYREYIRLCFWCARRWVQQEDVVGFRLSHL